jgi:hypothetical protein
MDWLMPKMRAIPVANFRFDGTLARSWHATFHRALELKDVACCRHYLLGRQHI